jgi:hypothetical protein
MVVKKDDRKEMNTMTSACHTPAWPTTKKKRRKISTPHMFSHVGTTTPLMVPKVPSAAAPPISLFFYF